MNKKIVFILLLIVVIIGFVSFFYYRDKIFTEEILRLEILSEDSVKMGEEIEYTVKYKNNGNFVLEEPKIIFELPENSLTEDSKIRFVEDLKDIYPGNEDFVKFRTRLLGKEGDLKVARATISYKPRNLSARYESETTFTSKIDSVNITLSFDLPLKIEKGEEVNYSINYFSNIDYPLENLSLKIDQINGFDFKSTDPISFDNLEWKLESLKKGQGGRIKIRGLVTNRADSYLNFVSKLGVWQNGEFIVIKETDQNVETIQTAKIEFAQKVYYGAKGVLPNDLGLENSGPIPPKVGEPTTYAVKWLIKNYFSEVRNLKVKAILPQNVSLRDYIFPDYQAANFSFDSESREIVWLAHNLLPDNSTEIYFQVAIIPDSSQRGRLVNLINQAVVFGEDISNGSLIQISAPAINTSLPDDEANSGGGVVQ